MAARQFKVIRPRSARTDLHRAIVFDADDTLWSTEWLYDQALEECQKLVESTGLNGRTWKRRYLEHDKRNVAAFGFRKERFATSVVSAYVEMAEESGHGVNASILTQLQRSASMVFKRKAPLLPGVVETLRSLRDGYQLVLMTKGDPDVQMKRIQDACFLQEFDAIVIVDEKDTATYRRMCRMLGIKPRESWCVGNNIASDIAPALPLGMQGVWIDAHVWEYERNRQHVIPERITRLRSLRQLLPVISQNAQHSPQHNEIS
ncbi:MAG: HAD family hydrolase [Candidatus Dormibacteria bacterium]